MITELRDGMKLTLIWIDSMMAMTHRKEIEVTSVSEPSRHGYQNEELRLGTYKQRGKRKQFYLDIKPHTLVFDGWDLSLKCDTDTYGSNGGVMRGNACYNFVGDEETIKDLLVNKQINDEVLKEDYLSCSILCDGKNEKLLFPEIRSNHAVINRMK